MNADEICLLAHDARVHTTCKDAIRYDVESFIPI